MSTRRDIQHEIDATRDAVYAQLLAGRENKQIQREEKLKEEHDMLSQIKESLDFAAQKKRSLLFQERRHLDTENNGIVVEKSQRRNKVIKLDRALEN